MGIKFGFGDRATVLVLCFALKAGTAGGWVGREDTEASTLV